jgi:PAS domain S-box-containing protein
MNPAGIKQLGFESTEEVVGRSLQPLHPPEIADLIVNEAIPTAIRDGMWRGETAMNRQDGTLRIIDQTIFPIRDNRGEIASLATIAVDITDRKHQEEEVRKHANELEVVAEVSASAATNLETRELLRAFCNLTKERFDFYHAHVYLIDEETGKLELAAGAGQVGKIMVEQGVSIPISRESSIVARAARTKEGVIVNDVTQSPAHLPNPLLAETQSEMAIPMVIGDQVVGVLDVQSNKRDRFSEGDVKIKSILADQLAVAIQNAQLFEQQVEFVDQMRELDRLKSEFLASMSHELRTPLNSIIGYAEVMMDGIDGPLTEDMEEDVSAIHSSGQLLLNLINDILDLAKIEAQQMDLDFAQIDLPRFLKEVAGTTEILLKGKPVEVILEVDGLDKPKDDLPVIEADTRRLQQVLNNLLSNAAKFTEQGTITLRSTYNTDHVCISVVDSGIGIEEEKLALVFERFRQVDQSSTRKAGGTGLGLAITKELVEMHGGEIWVESDYGNGATFSFTLPTKTEKVLST